MVYPSQSSVPPSGLAAAVDGRPGSEPALVRAAADGDPDATEELFRRHFTRVHRLAAHLLANDEESRDLVQDSFLDALESLPRLLDPRAFPRWLNLIVVRGAARLIKRRRLRRRLGLDAPNLEPLHEYVDRLVSGDAPPDVQAELRQIYGALDTLPARLRVVLVLRRVEGYELEEVARITHSSVSTIKRQIARAQALVERGGNRRR